MPPIIATGVFGIAILALFALDREREAKTSRALWIPVLWLIIVGSRPVSVWFQMTPVDSTTSSAELLDGSPVDRLVFLALLIVGLLVMAHRGQRAIALLRGNGPLLIFFSYCAISIVWSDFPDVAVKRWIKAMGDVVMVLIILTDVQPIVALKRVLARIGFVLILSSALLIKYYPDLGRAYDSWFGTPFWIGVTTNKNSLGVIALICGLGAAWRFCEEIRTRDKKDRLRHFIAQGILLWVSIWLLVKANSSTSLACFILGAALLAVTSLTKFGRRPVVVHLFAVGAISASLFAIFLDSSGGLVAAVGRDPTLTGRTEVWHTILGMAPNGIIGAGFEGFWLGPRVQKIWSIYSWHPNESHNGYIEVYLNLGWIGVLLLAVLLIAGYRNALSTFRRDLGAGSFRLAFIVVAEVYSLTEAGFRMLSPIWILLLLATMAVREVTPLVNVVGTCGDASERESLLPLPCEEAIH